MYDHLIPSRRNFIRSTAAAMASALFPWKFFSRKTDESFWFLHADTGASWEIPDPVEWPLANVNLPVLVCAAEGLVKLSSQDGDRIIRLVTRRCGLNLIEQSPGNIVVSYWGQTGLADVRPFFRKHQLARNDVQVFLKDRKKEIVTSHTGDDFLFGEKLATDWPLDLYLMKWRWRFVNHPDDWTAAPGTRSGYVWAGMEADQIPWTALKSAWRRGNAIRCQNCNRPTILVNFGEPWIALFRRSPKFIYICPACRRSFVDESVRDVGAWMVSNLDAQVWPGFVMNWDRRIRLASERRAFFAQRQSCPLSDRSPVCSDTSQPHSHSLSRRAF